MASKYGTVDHYCGSGGAPPRQSVDLDISRTCITDYRIRLLPVRNESCANAAGQARFFAQ